MNNMKTTTFYILFVLLLPSAGVCQANVDFLSFREVSCYLKSGDSASFDVEIRSGDSVRLSIQILNYRNKPSVAKEDHLQLIGKSLGLTLKDIKRIPRGHEFSQKLDFYMGDETVSAALVSDQYYDHSFRAKKAGPFSIQLAEALFISDQTHYTPNSIQSILQEVDYQIMGRSGYYIPLIYAIRLEVNGELIFWDRDSKAQITRIQQFNKDFTQFRPLTNDSRYVYAQNREHDIGIWKLGDTKPLKVFKGGSNHDLIEVKLNRIEPAILISIDKVGRVCLWTVNGVSDYLHSSFMIDDVVSGDEYSSMTVVIPVAAMALSPKGDLIAISSHRVAPYGGGFHYDFRVKIYDINLAYSQASSPLIQELLAHKTGVNKIAFSADGKTLVSKDGNGLICVWDTETWKLLSKETP